jgi:hypothetical protein
MKTSYPAIKKRLSSFTRLILKRQVPHTVVSWRFFVPGQCKAVKMHRAVFLKAWGRLPRWAWCLIFLYSHCLWILFYSWKKTIAALHRYAGETQREFHISVARQILDLLNLSLLQGIPPVFYYAYGLYRQPRERWLCYVYTHELPHWHTVMCGHRDLAAANRLLSDKHAFAREMAKADIRTPEIIAFFHGGEQVDAAKTFLGQSLFCKPNTGTQGRGCFELLYDRAIKDYRVIGEEIVEGEVAVLSYFQRKVADSDYIVQPLLVNHPEIRQLCGNQSRLATIRLITGHDGRKPVCIGALLEIPRSGEQKRCWFVPVDCRTGTLMPCARQGLASFYKEEDRPPDVTGKVLPCWKDALDICLRAHEHLSAVAAVGWDVAVTPSGAVLIEGNFNWRTAPWQAISGVPILETRLVHIYASRLWSNPLPPSQYPLVNHDRA